MTTLQSLSSPASVAGTTSPSLVAIPSLRDDELATSFRHTLATGSNVLFVANGFKVAMFQKPVNTQTWSPVASGEFGDDCIVAVTASSSTKRVYWDATALAEPQSVGNPPIFRAR